MSRHGSIGTSGGSGAAHHVTQRGNGHQFLLASEARRCRRGGQNNPYNVPSVRGFRVSVGYGHVYPGRYKSLPVEPGSHFLTLVRDVERNAQRAARVAKAEDWPWSSAHARRRGSAQDQKLLSPWPVPVPRGYRAWVKQSPGKEDIENIRDAIKKNRPYGSEQWVAKAVAQFGLENTMRNRGRPRNGS